MQKELNQEQKKTNRVKQSKEEGNEKINVMTEETIK